MTSRYEYLNISPHQIVDNFLEFDWIFGMNNIWGSLQKFCLELITLFVKSREVGELMELHEQCNWSIIQMIEQFLIAQLLF